MGNRMSLMTIEPDGEAEHRPDSMARSATDRATFGGRVKRAREAKGLSQEDLAAAIGVRALTVSRWERDAVETPSMPRLTKLSEVLEVSIEWLVTGEDARESHVEPRFEGLYAPADLVEQVIADLELDDELAERLRTTNWSSGLPSEGTLRSYALDMRRAKREAAKERESQPGTPRPPSTLIKRKKT